MSRRVLLVQANAERYGGDIMLLALVRGLTARGWGVTVSMPERGELTDALAAAGAAVVYAPAGAFRQIFGLRDWLRYLLVELPVSVLRLRRLARAADVVHVNSVISFGGILAGRVARRPVVWHLRESFQDQQTLWRVYGRLVGALADAAVGISRGGMDELAAAGVHNRVLVHDGLELPLPEPAPDPPRTGLVMIGRINSWKGQEVLVDALALLRRQGLDIPAVIAGGTFPGGQDFLERLQHQVEQEGLADLVRLPGYVQDTATLLAGATLYVQPSRRPEPFGLALAEAMARGLPCIATDAAGPRDLIEPGVTGLLVPLGDPVALADAIWMLWSDEQLRRRLGDAAQRDIPARFSADVMADAVVELYETLLR